MVDPLVSYQTFVGTILPFQLLELLYLSLATER